MQNTTPDPANNYNSKGSNEKKAFLTYSTSSASLLFAGNGDLLTLECPAVVLCPLASAGKPHFMPNAPVASYLLQSLNSQPIETFLLPKSRIKREA